MFPTVSQKYLPKKVNTGTLPEIPQICINAFSNPNNNGGEKLVDFEQSLAFFITHIDENILNDLFNPFFLRRLEYADENHLRLYMHKNCFRGIKYWIQEQNSPYEEKVEILGLLDSFLQNQKIIFIERNIPIRLHFHKQQRRRYSFGYEIRNKLLDRSKQVKEFDVEVTALSAGHSIGSIMLLLETVPTEKSEAKRILYTGNCRVTLHDLETSEFLMAKDGKPKPLTSLYIDTSNCIEAIEELPLRNEVEEALLKIIQKQLDENPSVRFEIWSSFCVSSSLNFLRSLHETFTELIHIPPKIENFFAKIPELCYLTNKDNGEGTPFHYGCKRADKNIYCGFNREIDVYDIFFYADLYSSSSINETEQMEKWNKSKQVVCLKEKLDYHALYASSLSRYEMGRMINFLEINPLNVKPLYIPYSKTLKQVQALMAASSFKMANMAPAPTDVNNNECDPSDGFDSSELYDFTGPNLNLHTKDEAITFTHVDKAPGLWYEVSQATIHDPFASGDTKMSNDNDKTAGEK